MTDPLVLIALAGIARQLKDNLSNQAPAQPKETNLHHDQYTNYQSFGAIIGTPNWGYPDLSLDIVPEVEEYLPKYVEEQCPIPTLYFLLVTGGKGELHPPFLVLKLMGQYRYIHLKRYDLTEDKGELYNAVKHMMSYAQKMQEACNNSIIIDQTLYFIY